MEAKIQTIISYDGEAFITVSPIGVDIEWDGDGHLFHRQDFNEDGSITDWYGVELSEEVYKLILNLKFGKV